MSRARFGGRGESYVAAQVVLLILVIAGPARVGDWPSTLLPASTAVNVAVAVLVLAGALLLVSGSRRLGHNLTPLPMPKPSATFVQDGVYHYVRHPIYGGLMLVALGWSLRRGGGLVWVYVALLVLLLESKSRREEIWLTLRFPDYAAYRARTRRFLPWLW